MTPFTAAAQIARTASRSLTVLAGAGLLLCAVSACNTTKKAETAISAPTDGWDSPAAVDIENFHGSVTIIVDPTLTQIEPIFKARASLWVTDAVRKQAVESVKFQTRTQDQDGRAVLSIKTSSKWGDPTEVWADITLKMPRCDGVRIFNRGGAVRLVGISGAAQIDNGAFAGTSGPIEIRTEADMLDPVALVTNNGSVVYQVGPGSTGAFTLDSETGSESFDSDVISPSMVHSNGKVTTATVGSAENAVLLRSAKGDVYVVFMKDAERYTNPFR